MKVVPHTIELLPEDGNKVMIHPASPQSVSIVHAADVDSIDGRSQPVWIRLPDGTLILGVFPQGDTYLACEVDAQYPRD